MLFLILCFVGQAHAIFRAVEVWKRWESWEASGSQDKITLVWGNVTVLFVGCSLLYVGIYVYLAYKTVSTHC